MRFNSLVMCLFLVTYPYNTEGTTTDTRTAAKKFHVALTQQSLHTVLLSIEERLRNLDNIYAMQYSPGVEGKLEQYGRKLETVEAKISRLEAVMSNELDKISENISSRNFKDDLTRDHVLRKIDSIYERVNHRLIFAESKMDLTERKLDNKLDTILSRLEKMEDSIEIKDTDMQGEIEEVLTYVEDIKSQTDSIEEKLNNVTKTLQENVGVIQADDTPDTLKNENITAMVRKDMKEHFEVLSNKIVDFHETSWQTYDRLERTLRSMSLVSNLTRYEIQNGLRSLTVEVGRLSGSSILSDSSKDKTKLQEIDKKIDSNFESLMLAQNLFMENCYRLQKDEPQLETKISEVLDEMITTFNEKTAVEPKDIRRLERTIRNHDQNVKKMTENTMKTLGAILYKAQMYSKKIEDGLETLEAIKVIYLNSKGCGNQTTVVFNKLEEALWLLKDLHNTTENLNKSIQNDTKNFIATNTLQQIVDKLEDLSRNDNQGTELNSLKTSIANVKTILEHIRQNISDPENKFTNEHLDKLKIFLDDYIKYKTVNNIFNWDNETKTNNMTNIDQKIKEIFGIRPNLNFSQGSWAETIEKISRNCFPSFDKTNSAFSSNIECFKRYLNSEIIQKMQNQCSFKLEATKDEIIDCLRNITAVDIFSNNKLEISEVIEEINEENVSKIVRNCFPIPKNISNFECFANLLSNKVLKRIENECSLNIKGFTEDELSNCLRDLTKSSNISGGEVIEIKLSENIIEKIKNECLPSLNTSISQNPPNFDCLRNILDNEMTEKVLSQCINGSYDENVFVNCLKVVSFNIVYNNSIKIETEDDIIAKIKSNCFPALNPRTKSLNTSNIDCLRNILDEETIQKIQNRCSLDTQTFTESEILICLENIRTSNSSANNITEDQTSDIVEIVKSNCFPDADKNIGNLANIQCLQWLLDEQIFQKIQNECSLNSDILKEDEVVTCLNNITGNNNNKKTENFDEETIERIKSNCFPRFDVRQSEISPNLECLNEILGENVTNKIVNRCALNADNLVEEKLLNCLRNTTKEIETSDVTKAVSSITKSPNKLPENLNLNKPSDSTLTIQIETTTENDYSPAQTTPSDYAEYLNSDYDT